MFSGNFISYVNYADAYLHFQRTLNHGGGGRMFTPYADDTLSLAMNFGNITNNESDIIVVFAGVNDYLSTPNIADKVAFRIYCALNSFCYTITDKYHIAATKVIGIIRQNLPVHLINFLCFFFRIWKTI